MASRFSQLSKKQKWLMGITCVCYFPMIFLLLQDPEVEAERAKKRKEKASAEARVFFRNFKVELKSGFWGVKKQIIQREKPLTDEELELVMKDVKNFNSLQGVNIKM